MNQKAIIGGLIVLILISLVLHNAGKHSTKQVQTRESNKGIPNDHKTTTPPKKTPTKVQTTNRIQKPPPPVHTMPKPEVPKEPERKFRERNFDTSGRSYIETSGIDCEEASQIATMTESSVHACEAMCAADSQCGAFSLDKDGRCSTFMSCYQKEAPHTTGLFVRE